MVYDEMNGIISFICKEITIEYKRFNGGNMTDNKKIAAGIF